MQQQGPRVGHADTGKLFTQFRGNAEAGIERHNQKYQQKEATSWRKAVKLPSNYFQHQ